MLLNSNFEKHGEQCNLYVHTLSKFEVYMSFLYNLILFLICTQLHIDDVYFEMNERELKCNEHHFEATN